MTPKERGQLISVGLRRHFREKGSHWKGRKQSPEHIEKRRLAHLGKRRTPEQRRAMSLRMRGTARHTTPHSEATRAKLASYLGSRTSNWKGGVTARHKVLRGTARYREWRQAVFERDDYTCQMCGKRSKRGDRFEINADHIKPFAYFPDLRFEVSNGRTLCVPCHKTTDTYLRRGQLLYGHLPVI